MESSTVHRSPSRGRARATLVSLGVAFIVVTTLATAAASPAPQRQDPARILFGTVDADWVWEPTPVPSTPAEISAPELVRTILPRHPSSDTLRAGYRGHVIVEATITPTGQVTEARIVRTPAPGIFDDTVLAAVRQWSFRPATQAGVPVAVTGIFTFEFKATYEAPAGAAGVAPAAATNRRANAIPLVGSTLIPPLQISTELPEYTEAAEQAGIEGDVYIEAVVTKEGTVVEPELIRGLADDELNRRALEAITRWRFEPGMKDDEPVDVIALFTVTYRIH